MDYHDYRRYEEVYREAGGDPDAVPWARLQPNRLFLSWAQKERLKGNGLSALVVGCGLGDDAEELQRRGFAVTAFDISETAIRWCKRRFPESKVDYATADLFNLPEDWNNTFDFVFEAHTLQAISEDVRPQAMEDIAKTVKPGGRLFVSCFGRNKETPAGDVPPWLLLKNELDHFVACGLEVVSFETVHVKGRDRAAKRFRAVYAKPSK